MIKSNKESDLISKKHKIEKEIEELQQKCTHSSKSLKSVKERLDTPSTCIRWVCDKCSMSLAYPNDKELEKYLNGR